LRSARARRVELVVVSFDIDDELLLMLLSLALLPVVPRVALPVVPAPYDVVPDVDPVAPVVPVPVVPVLEEPFVEPVAVPVERVVLLPLLMEPLLLFIDPLVDDDPVVPAFGPVLVVLLLGEPDAPPWPLVEPVCASAPPHAIAAAAERARILRVCLMGYS
jgi:hypothetical protein